MREVPIPDAYWVVPGRLLAGEYAGAPTDAQAQAKLRRFLAAGVTCFVDLTQEGELHPYGPLVGTLSGGTARHVRHAVRDLGIPSRAGMRAILDTIQGALDADEVVYVHCWGGIGRTGTVVGCYLIEQGTPAAQALHAIERLRRGIPDEWRSSPETNEQRAFVRSWQPLDGAPR